MDAKRTSKEKQNKKSLNPTQKYSPSTHVTSARSSTTQGKRKSLGYGKMITGQLVSR